MTWERRDEGGAADARGGVFVGLAHVEQEVRGAFFSELMQLLHTDDGDDGRWRDAAEVLVVDGFGDGRLVTTRGTVRITAQGEGSNT